MESIIRVGVGVMVMKDGKFLYGKRTGKHGENSYGPPGGHLEFGEEIEQCSVRELYEESGLIAQSKDVKIFTVLNEIYPNKEKHYISVITVIQNYTGELLNKEPHKLEEWKWMSWEEIKNLGDTNFLPMQNFIKKYPDFDPIKI